MVLHVPITCVYGYHGDIECNEFTLIDLQSILDKLTVSHIRLASIGSYMWTERDVVAAKDTGLGGQWG